MRIPVCDYSMPEHDDKMAMPDRNPYFGITFSENRFTLFRITP
ncbi:hypothetical protein ACE10Z_30475 [Bradyrhizobium sp. Pha-3]